MFIQGLRANSRRPFVALALIASLTGNSFQAAISAPSISPVCSLSVSQSSLVETQSLAVPMEFARRVLESTRESLQMRRRSRLSGTDADASLSLFEGSEEVSVAELFWMEFLMKTYLSENALDEAFEEVMLWQKRDSLWEMSLPLLLARMVGDRSELLDSTRTLIQRLDAPKTSQLFEETVVAQTLSAKVLALVKPLLGQGLEERDLREVLHVAREAIGAHLGRKQLRDSGEHYMVHPIGVAEILIHLFGITDPLALEVTFLHDVLEDQADAYETMMIVLRLPFGYIKDPLRIQLLALGIRMLTHDKSKPEEFYWRGLQVPWEIYPEDPYLHSHPDASTDPVFLRFLLHVQLIKLSDRIHNWRDFDGFLKVDGEEMGAHAQGRPSRSFEKTFKHMLVDFVNSGETSATRIHLESFYQALAEALFTHTALRLSDYPRAAPLRDAARAAMPGLAEGISRSLYFAASPNLQNLHLRLTTEPLREAA